MEACSYMMLQTLYDGVERYGIAILQESNGKKRVVREIKDISCNKIRVCQLVDRCNCYQLSDCQVMDIIEDFLGIL